MTDRFDNVITLPGVALPPAATPPRREVEGGRIFAVAGGSELQLYQDGNQWALDHVARTGDSVSRLGKFVVWLDAMHAAFNYQDAMRAIAGGAR